MDVDEALVAAEAVEEGWGGSEYLTTLEGVEKGESAYLSLPGVVEPPSDWPKLLVESERLFEGVAWERRRVSIAHYAFKKLSHTFGEMMVLGRLAGEGDMTSPCFFLKGDKCDGGGGTLGYLIA